jgi:hypothetical protein
MPDNIKTPVDTLEVVLCPQCGSASVDYEDSKLVLANMEATAKCRACEFQGPFREFISSTFKVRAGLADSVTDMYTKDIVLFVKEEAMPLGRILVKYGFLDSKSPNPKEMSEYLIRAAKAIAQSFIQTRSEVIEGMRNGPR